MIADKHKYGTTNIKYSYSDVVDVEVVWSTWQGRGQLDIILWRYWLNCLDGLLSHQFFQFGSSTKLAERDKEQRR